jgi:hypothetical protein
MKLKMKLIGQSFFKKFLCLPVFIIALAATAQESPAQPEMPAPPPAATVPQEASNSRSPFYPTTMYVTLGAIGILNAMDVPTSAPSPILFTPGFAAGWDVYRDFFTISVEGRLSFFMSPYIWDGENALPGEYENRTAFVTALILDIPVLYTQEFGNHTIHAGLGFAFVPRFSSLAWNVKPEASGASGTAAGDVEEISTWFYQKARILYPEIVFAWDYYLSNGWRAGFDVRAYIPFGNGAAADEHPLNGGMLSIAVKIVLPF